VINPNLGKGAIIGITCAILVVLFSIQPFGVARISIAFAPIVITWLLFNFCVGIYNLACYDHSVLKAFSPYFAGQYFVRNKTEGWKSLGGMLLAFTGVEALFADLGAFSKRAIQISWLGLAYPCLLVAYIGQAAYIADNPKAYSNPFFNSLPPGAFWPAFIISILAAVVASQALITSTFQLLFQIINMSYFPPISYRYTSTKHHTQIFIPVANWLLMIGTIVVTSVFRDTTKLGNAYGVCVILDTVVTTSLVALVAIIVWRIRWWIVFPLWLIEATFEGLYMTSALTKVPDGAWFTLGLAVILAMIFTTWRYGKEKQWAVERKGRLRLNRLVSKGKGGGLKLNPGLGGQEIITTKGIGIFFDKPGGDFVPVIYEEFLRKFEAQPEVQVFLHLRATTVPFVPDDERYAVTRTGLPNCYRMIIRYGYSEQAVSPQLGRIIYDELRKYITSMGQKPAPTPGDATQNPPSIEDATHTSTDMNKDESTSEDAEKGQLSAAGSISEGNVAELDSQIQKRLETLDSAYRSQTIYLLGKEHLKMPERGVNIFKRFLLGVYLFMRDSTGEKVVAFRIPMNKMVEVGFIKEL
jgi:KUP system potassium uptake protein